jgi:hypothetical protein
VNSFFRIFAAGGICVALLPAFASADSFDHALTTCLIIADISIEFRGAPGTGPVDEAIACAGAINAYLVQQAAALLPAVGQLLFAGNPVSLFPAGATGLLDFRFIDPATGLPAMGPPIGSVDYQVNVNPAVPGDFVDIGSSSDAATDFAVPFTVQGGTEPVFLATPFSPSGDAIFIAGTGGSNDARAVAFNATVPEPSYVVLAGCASALVAFMRRPRGTAVRGWRDGAARARR